MEITNTPVNFKCIKHYKLATRPVLECIAGNISPQTKQNPKELVETFQKLFELQPDDIERMAKTPFGITIYEAATGIMLRKNNKKLQEIFDKIKNIPRENQYEKIDSIAKEIGDKINVVIDDSIQSYK